MSFSDVFRSHMEKYDLKQADICRLTGIQTSLISEYLSGKKSPALSNAIAIADAFGITLDELVGKEEPLEIARKPISERAKGICERMRQERVTRNHTQEQIANYLGLKANTYAAYERLEIEPSVDMIYALCQFYGESIDEWIGLKTEKTNVTQGSVSGIKADTGEYVEQLPQDDIEKLTMDLAELPPEALGEIKTIIEFIAFKYKNK